jgi:hypothetical protein
LEGKSVTIRQKKCTDTSRCIFLTEGNSLSFEFATGAFTIGFGVLDPTLAGTGILARTAGGGGSAGAGTFARVHVEALTGFFSGSSVHRGNGEHGGCSSSESNSGSFPGCNHW